MSDSNPTPTDFWVGDYLKRSGEAKYLTKYLAARYHVKKSEEGFVLAVNGEWGLGKSFMIERWNKELEHAGHPVVMFNSWENDFTPEPLVAFVAELNSALSKQFDRLPIAEELRKSWLKKAKAVLVPTLKVVGMAALKRGAGVGIDEITNLYNGSETNVGDANEEDSSFDTKEIAEKLAKAVDDELKSHSNVKSAIIDFKSRLGSLVKYLEGQSQVQLPIFVFIDELDRCRPDYAIKLLEGIKHLFGVPGIHFIVATNLSELAHSVRAVYGEKFSAERYLKRFFDMEYSLPEPEGIDFAAELMMPLSELTNCMFVTGMEQEYAPDQFPAKNLSFIFVRYAVAFDLSLRDQQQVAKVLEAALLTLGNTAVHIHLLMFLAALYQKNSQLYHEVAKLNSIPSTSSILNPMPHANTSVFVVQDSDREGQRKRVTVKAIGELYLSVISGNQLSGQRNYDFPNSMLANSRSVQERDALAKYVEIVRRAGQFAK